MCSKLNFLLESTGLCGRYDKNILLCFFSVYSVEDVIVKLDGVNNKHAEISENNSDISDRVLHLYYDEINVSFIDAFHVFVG